MRIFQITDLHIARIGQETINNIDVWGKFKAALAKAVEVKPDLLVISGDLCYQEGELEIYQCIKIHLDDSGLDYLVIAGNHDDSTLVSKIFQSRLNKETGESYYIKHFPQGDIIFLDSVKKIFSEQQWQWFSKQVAQQKPSLIFTHHPPVIVGTPFMDRNHCFLQMDKFAKVAETSNDSLSIFCGHYHVERVVHQKNMTIFVTPSTMVQINGAEEEYTLDHDRTGYRIIDWDGVLMQTYVGYI